MSSHLNKIRRMAGIDEIYVEKKPLTEDRASNEEQLKKYINTAVHSVEQAIKALNEGTKLVHTDDLKYYRAQLEELLSSDGGEGGLKRLLKTKWGKAIREGEVTDELMIESCGIPHDENEETTVGPVECPICGEHMRRGDFYNHMMGTHKEMMRSGYESPENEEDNAEDEDSNFDTPMFNKGQHVEYEGEMYVVVVPDAQANFVGIAPIGQEDDPDAVDLVRADELKSSDNDPVAMDVQMEGSEDATVWDDAMDDKDESPESPKEEQPKFKVPSKITNRLKKEIKELRDEAERIKTRDSMRAEFYDDCADAMEVIHGFLEQGTRDGIKLAQVHMTKLMSPIVQRIPDDVYDYISGGGEPVTLKKLFQKVKEKK